MTSPRKDQRQSQNQHLLSKCSRSQTADVGGLEPEIEPEIEPEMEPELSSVTACAARPHKYIDWSNPRPPRSIFGGLHRDATEDERNNREHNRPDGRSENPVQNPAEGKRARRRGKTYEGVYASNDRGLHRYRI